MLKGSLYTAVNEQSDQTGGGGDQGTMTIASRKRHDEQSKVREWPMDSHPAVFLIDDRV